MFEIEEPQGGNEGRTSLDFLQAVYRCPDQPLSVRMKAAVAALPYEFPKLCVTAIVPDDGSFAAKLDLARARSAKVIEARAEPAKPPPQMGRPPTPLGAPMARIRRW
jgi:hypothetical protein